MIEDLSDRFAKIDTAIKQSAYNYKKQYDQSGMGKFHREFNLWMRFWEGFSASIQFLYKKLVYPISIRLWGLVKWLMIQYRTLWLYAAYRKDSYGKPQFSRIRGATIILSTMTGLYILYAVIQISITLPWYFLTVKYDEVLYLSNHSAVEGFSKNKLKINDVYEITGCEAINCSDQDTVSFRVEATWFNEAWSVMHHFAFYYPDYVVAAVSPVVNRCIITSYGIRQKFLVREYELHPDILQVRCVPVGLENEKSYHNKDYR